MMLGRQRSGRRPILHGLAIVCALATTLASASPRAAAQATHGGSHAASRSPAQAFSSGTSWEPASSRHRGRRFTLGAWSLDVHGFVNAVFAQDPGPRGARDLFSTNMLGLRATRRLGPGRFEGRLMMSAEATMGRDGYPLLLQTGETADGLTPLVDRQHPHDLFAEIAALYSVPIGQGLSLYLYGGPVAEPAIGPTTFMHRASYAGYPVAPLSHHFLDATHISYGVVTLGLSSEDRLKVELSAFNGNEPDQDRWDFESPRLSSVAFRVTMNPTADWSIQGSIAQLNSPEQLHPGIDIVRLTASATYNRGFPSGEWRTTIAYGRNKRQRTVIPLAEARRTFSPPVLSHYVSLAGSSNLPADSLSLLFPTSARSALLLETAVRLGQSTLMLRIEAAEKDELLPPADPRHSEIFTIGKVSAAYLQDLPVRGPIGIGLGLSGSVHMVPGGLKPDYGESLASYLLFTRFRIR